MALRIINDVISEVFKMKINDEIDLRQMTVPDLKQSEQWKLDFKQNNAKRRK